MKENFNLTPSRRDLLTGAGVLGGLAFLAACSGNKQPTTTPTESAPATTTQPTFETPWSTYTPTATPVETKTSAPLDVSVNDTYFDGWNGKSEKQRSAAMADFLKDNGVYDPMPEYEVRQESRTKVPAISDWMLDRCAYLQDYYHSPGGEKYGGYMVRDVLTRGGKNVDDSDNLMYEIIRDNKRILRNGTYELYAVSDVQKLENDPDDPKKKKPGCLLAFKYNEENAKEAKEAKKEYKDFIILELKFENDGRGKKSAQIYQAYDVDDIMQVEKTSLYETPVSKDAD